MVLLCVASMNILTMGCDKDGIHRSHLICTPSAATVDGTELEDAITAGNWNGAFAIDSAGRSGSATRCRF